MEEEDEGGYLRTGWSFLKKIFEKKNLKKFLKKIFEKKIYDLKFCNFFSFNLIKVFGK